LLLAVLEGMEEQTTHNNRIEITPELNYGFQGLLPTANSGARVCGWAFSDAVFSLAKQRVLAPARSVRAGVGTYFVKVGAEFQPPARRH